MRGVVCDHRSERLRKARLAFPVNIWRRVLNRVTRQKPNASRTPFIGRTQSGVRVDQDNALKYAAVWGCVNVISKSIAILPWTVYQRTQTGRESALDHPVNW